MTALEQAATAFGSTYAREVAFDPGIWRARTESAVVLLAIADDRAVGTATLVRPPDEPGSGEINGCFVRDEWRGTGLAAALVEAVVEHATELTELGLWVSSDNPRAAALYRRCGFTETGQTQPHNYPGLHLARMTRRIQIVASAD